MTDLRPDPQAIYREQVDTVFGLLPMLLWVDLLSGGVLVGFVFLSTQNYTSLMYVWLGAVVTASVLRLLIARHMQQISTLKDNLAARSHMLLVCAITTGLIWGTTWLIMPFDSIDPPKGAITLWPCAVMASAVANLAIIKRLFFSLTITIIGSQVIFLLVQGTTRDLQLIIAFAVYGSFILMVANSISNDLNRGIVLKLQNRFLHDKLSRDQITLKQNEEALFAQIEREKALLAYKRNSDAQLAIAVEEKLLLLDSAGEGIFGTNADGKITFMNSMALKLLGFTEKEVLGQDALGLVTRRNSSKENETRNVIIGCFKEGRSFTSIKGSFFGKHDKLLPVNFSCRPMTKEERFIGAVVSFFDMSEQIAMESQLTKAQKMEAIGRITGGVAHDFNNLLTALLGNLQFLKKRLNDGDTVSGAKIIDKLMQAAKRGSELNNRLLSYSREQALHNAAEDISNILREMQDFLIRTLGEDIKLELHLDGVSNYAMIDRARLENLILNVCLNAKDAMPEGGSLTISCRRSKGAVKTVLASNDTEGGDHVEITITDTGTGIPLTIQDKIFDPFFTTKAAGEGTGFGLSTGFGFIQQSGGNIEVQSDEGAGATFIIQIPAIPHADILKHKDFESAANDMRYNGTVLVVEDDDDVREVATQMLVDAGYRVITASNGPEGLEKYRAQPGINLIFSDIVMPGGMTGIEMARKILELDPHTPVILATGYTEKMLIDRIEEMGHVVCIAKPYDTQQLPSMINDMLRSKTGTHDE